MKVLICLMALLWMLAGCGGGESAGESEAKPASNPLADEQQLIRDAKAVEAMLEKDAEEKREAVDNLN